MAPVSCGHTLIIFNFFFFILSTSLFLVLQESPVSSCIFPASVQESAISPESPGSLPQRVVLLISCGDSVETVLESQCGQKMTCELSYFLSRPSPHFMESLEKYRKKSKKMKSDWAICPGRLDTRDWLAGVCSLNYCSHKISSNMYFLLKIYSAWHLQSSFHLTSGELGLYSISVCGFIACSLNFTTHNLVSLHNWAPE